MKINIRAVHITDNNCEFKRKALLDEGFRICKTRYKTKHTFFFFTNILISE